METQELERRFDELESRLTLSERKLGAARRSTSSLLTIAVFLALMITIPRAQLPLLICIAMIAGTVIVDGVLGMTTK